MTLSTIAIPNLMLPARQPPSTILPLHEPGTPIPHLAHQWLDLYERGKNRFPVIALVASAANGYLAWVLRDTPAPDSVLMCCGWTGCYTTAVAVTMGMVVWTLTAMKGTNVRLTVIATRDDTMVAKGTKGMIMDDSEVPALLKRWANLNLIRAAFPLAGAAIGIFGIVLMK